MARIGDGPVSFIWTTLPGNAASVIPIDTTRLGGVSTASVGAGSAFLVPGPDRNMWNRAVVEYTVLCTTQNVTLLLEVLTGNAGTAADWEAQGAPGTVAVTAGTTATGEFKPLAPDWRIRILAGATAPATLVVRGTVDWGSDYGN